MFERRLPPEYRAREATLVPWNEKGFEAQVVQAVLRVLARAFGWKEADALRLRPEDRLWPIYRHYYPQSHWWHRGVPDELELESLQSDLQHLAADGKRIDFHTEITVGELVRLVAGEAA
jgi:hypothetical protein